MQIGRIEYEIEIPEDITLTLDGSLITVKGKLGELKRDFSKSKVQLEKTDNIVKLSSYFPRRKEKALIGTVRAHINNMIKGTTYGYKYFLKIVYSHFPIRVSPENKKNRVKVDNLYGGRKPLYAKIVPGVNVEVQDEDIIVTGINKEAVGQSAANIQELTRQRGKRRKSPKTFQDGLYVYERGFQENPEN